MKTSELQFSALSFLVAMIEMPHLVWGETIGIHHAGKQVVVPELPEPQCYSPFTDWCMFGPIMEREEIELHKWAIEGWKAKATSYSFLNTPQECDTFAESFGPTPLIAAMRCYVASKLGDDVEIPEELK